MSDIIEINHIVKEFKVLNHHDGLKGAFKDLFSHDYKIVRAVDDITMSIKQGEIVRIHRSEWSTANPQQLK